MDNRQNQDRYDQGYQGGWNQQNQQNDQWRDRSDLEGNAYMNRNEAPNPGYGEVYHGNLKQREEETNRARGRNYGNQQGGQRYGQNANSGGYGQVGNTGGGHGAWESFGSSNQDMGGNFQPYENRYGQRQGTSSYNSGHVQPTSGRGQQYNDGNSGYGRERRRYDDDDNNNWWDRTKEKVSSWFNDDDDDNNRRNYGSDYRQGNQQYTSGMGGASGQYRSGGEHRGKGPKGYQRSDERIREDVCDRLYQDGYVDASEIDVKVEGCEVVLSGSVRSREEKRRAEDLVENIMGVRHVENRIRVNQESNWRDSGNRQDDSNRYSDSGRNQTSGSSNLENRSYTGNSGDGTGIGNESGTTNEIIRNSGNLDTNK